MSAEKARARTDRRVLRMRNRTHPHPPRPAVLPHHLPYGVRVRNTDEQPRDIDWAAYAKRAREAAVPPIGQSELARRLGTDRTTIWRWEHGRQRPDDQGIVIKWADVLSIDRGEALAAAGLALDATPPPTPAVDEEVEMILRADVDQRTKEMALEQLHRMRMRDKQRRLEDIQTLILRRRPEAG